MSKRFEEMTDEEIIQSYNEDGPEEEEAERAEEGEEFEDVEDFEEDLEDDSEESEEGSQEIEGEEESGEVNWEEKAKKLEADLEEERKTKKGLEEVLGRQGKDLGDKKKKIEELQRQIAIEESPEVIEQYNDRYIENPYETTKEVAKRERELEAKRKELYDLQVEEIVAEQESTIREAIPEFDDLKETIEEVLRLDGIEEKVIEKVMRNPFMEHPSLMIQIAKRASVLKENKELRAKYGKEKGKNERVLDNVEKAARMGKPLNGRMSGSSSKGTGALTDADIWSMSSEEINKVAEKLFKTGG